MSGERITVFASVRTGPDLWPHEAQHGELLVHTAHDGSPWALCLHCPCGCGSPVMVPSAQAVSKQQPFWVLTHEEDGTYSASPSVLMTDPKGCKAHYWLRHNRIDWC